MRTVTKSPDYIDVSGLDVFHARRLPARLEMRQVGRLLNFQIYELRLLVGLGLLRCLNASGTGPNSRKWFSSAYILSLAADLNWLAQATKAVAKSVKQKNGHPHRPLPERLAAV